MITFLRRHSRRLDRAQPDGNCLFRSLSKQLFHSEKHHSTLRKTLTGHAASYPEVYISWTIEGLSLQEHILKMKEPGTWGSQLEIAAAATLFQKTIYVASDSLVPNECRWTAFPPLTIPETSTVVLGLTSHPPTNKQAWLEIAHSNQCHYDAISSIEVCKPPVLTGQTVFVPDIL